MHDYQTDHDHVLAIIPRGQMRGIRGRLRNLSTANESFGFGECIFILLWRRTIQYRVIQSFTNYSLIIIMNNSIIILERMIRNNILQNKKPRRYTTLQ